jgi:hypothetical protein
MTYSNAFMSGLIVGEREDSKRLMVSPGPTRFR